MNSLFKQYRKQSGIIGPQRRTVRPCKTIWMIFMAGRNIILAIFLSGLLLLIQLNFARSQNIIPSKGKNFWLGFLQNYSYLPSNRLDIFITSEWNTNGTLTIPQQGYSVNFSVIANQTTTVNIPNTIAEHYSTETIDNKGIHIVTDDTVSVFAINFKSYTADGTVVYPVQSIGTDYQVSMYTVGSEFLIVATEDQTQVTITPSQNTTGGHLAGIPYLVSLNAGESYQVKSSNDLSGSTITGTASSGSCRPFAVFSGNNCANIPVNCYYCDHIFEQNLPKNLWGNVYYAAPFASTTRYSLRILSGYNGTSYTLNGTPGPVLNAGQSVILNGVTTASCISASNPISVVQFMEGRTCSGAGDPAMLYLNDADQTIDKITFSTVSSTVITVHRVNVIMKTACISQLKLDGNPVPSNLFSTFPSCNTQSYVQLALTQGSHTLEADSGFYAYVYGTGQDESYAYSTGSYSKAKPIQIDSVLCSSDTMYLGTTSQYFNEWWSTQSAPNDTIGTGPLLTLYPPIIPGIYIEHVSEYLSGCTKEFYFSVEVPDPPALSLSASADTICKNQSTQLFINLNPSGGLYHYQWFPAYGLSDSLIPNPVATPVSSCWYHVRITSPNGCMNEIQDSIFIHVKNDIMASAGILTPDTSLCIGDTVNLQSLVEEVLFEDNFNMGPFNNKWSQTTGIISSVCGSNTGDALYFNNSGARFASTQNLNLSAGGIIQFRLKIAAGSAPCEDADPGENVILTYSVNSGTTWTPIAVFNEALYPQFTLVNIPLPPAAATASTMLRWSQAIHSGANEDNWALDDISLRHNAVSGYSFSWSPSAALLYPLAPQTPAAPDSNIIYSLVITDSISGCMLSDSVFIYVHDLPVIELGADSTLCSGPVITIDAGNSGVSWQWSNGSTTQSISCTSSGNYMVTVTNAGGCTATDSLRLDFIPVPVPPLGNDTSLCEGNTIQLLAQNPGSSYLWSGGDTTQSIAVIQSGTYILTVTTGGLCRTEDSIQVSFLPLPAITLMPDTQLCSGNLLTLDAGNSGSGYLWSTGFNGPSIAVTVTGNYWVEVTDSNGCSNADSVKVTFMPLPVVNIGSDTAFCQGGQILLQAGNPGAEFLWSDGSTLSIFSTGTSGVVVVSVTDSFHCMTVDSIRITVFPLPLVRLGADTVLCAGDSLLLSAGNSGVSFFWSTHQHTASILIRESGSYQVYVTDSHGCISADDILVQFKSPPSILMPSFAMLCIGDSMQIQPLAPEAVSSIWAPTTWLQPDSGISALVFPQTPMSYTVTIQDSMHCTSSAIISIGIKHAPSVDLGQDTTFCEGQAITLHAGGGEPFYSWNNHTGDSLLTVSAGGTYWVEVQNSCGSKRDSVVIGDPFPLPFPVLGHGGEICREPTPVLDAGNEGCIYNWSDGTTTRQMYPAASGTYTVTVTSEHQCTASGQIQITILDQPKIDLGADTLLCIGQALKLDATAPYAAYMWQDGTQNPYLIVSQPGWYRVRLTNQCGSDMDSLFVDYSDCICRLYVPNAFTPNEDGLNDQFLPQTYCEVNKYRFRVFNRWGELLFETSDFRTGWNGLKNNQPSPEGIYVYDIRYEAEIQGQKNETRNCNTFALIR